MGTPVKFFKLDDIDSASPYVTKGGLYVVPSDGLYLATSDSSLVQVANCINLPVEIRKYIGHARYASFTTQNATLSISNVKENETLGVVSCTVTVTFSRSSLFSSFNRYNVFRWKFNECSVISNSTSWNNASTTSSPTITYNTTVTSPYFGLPESISYSITVVSTSSSPDGPLSSQFSAKLEYEYGYFT